jgi:tetratricopeptide (TPR) repeat protein
LPEDEKAKDGPRPTKADIPRLLALLEQSAPDDKWKAQLQLIGAYCDADEYPKALDAYKACKDRVPDELKSELVQAVTNVLEQYGEITEAITLVTRRIKDLDVKGETRTAEMGRLQLKLGQLIWRQGRLDEAMEHSQLALAIFTDDAFSMSDQIAVLTSMGMILWEKGDYDMALKCLDQGLEKAEAAGLEDKIGNANNSLGLVHYQLGNYFLSLKHFGAARVYSKDNRSTSMFVENNIGLVHQDMGDYHIAKLQYERCLQMSDELEHFVGMALAHLNLGLLAIEMGDPDKARDQLEESLSLCRHMKERWIQALNRIGLARAYIMKGNLSLAQHNAEMALKLGEEMKAKETRGMALRELGLVEELGGKADEARRHLDESVSIFEAMRNRYELAKSLLALGRFLAGVGKDATNGKKAFERALSIAKEIGAKGVQNNIEKALSALT